MRAPQTDTTGSARRRWLWALTLYLGGVASLGVASLALEFVLR